MSFKPYENSFVVELKRASESIRKGRCGSHIFDQSLEIDPYFFEKMEKASLSIIKQIMRGNVLRKTKKAFGLTTPKSTHPDFISIDFASVNGSGDKITPKLVELQGFPSLSGVAAVAEQCRGDEGLVEILRSIILKDTPPENTVMLESNLKGQVTIYDFEITQTILGITPIDIKDVRFKNDIPYYFDHNGSPKQIKAIYNRVIPSTVPAEQRDNWEKILNAEVRWVSHPDWYNAISKASMPFIKGDFNPYCTFAEGYTGTLKNKVLKPIWGHGGKGINLEPTKSDIAFLRVDWLIQDKLKMRPTILSPNGKLLFSEFRMMYALPAPKSKPILMAILFRAGETTNINITGSQTNMLGFCHG